MAFVDFRSVLKVSGGGVPLPSKRPSRVTFFFKWNNSSLSPSQQTVRQTETDSAPLHLARLLSHFFLLKFHLCTLALFMFTQVYLLWEL